MKRFGWTKLYLSIEKATSLSLYALEAIIKMYMRSNCIFLIRVFFIVLLHHAVVLKGSAQEVPKIIKYDQKDFRAADQNWMIAQDCEGFIFVANTDGVLIYNGFFWQMLSMPNHQKPRAIRKGKDCQIYVGGYEFFGKIDRSNRFKPKYVPIADSLFVKTGQEIWNILENGSSIFLQSFSDAYLYDYNKLKEIEFPSNIMLGTNVGEQYFIPKIEEGLYILEDKKVRLVPESLDLPAHSKVTGIAKLSQNSFLLGTLYNGLFILKDNQLSPINSDLNQQLQEVQINKLVALESGGFAIGTILSGVFVLDQNLHLKYHLNKSNGLSNNTVLSLFEDQNSDLWVGLDKGINLVKLSSSTQYFYDYLGQLGTVFTSIVYDGQLYLGTNQGIFRTSQNASDGREGKKNEYQLVKESQGQIWSFLIADGDLLSGHNSGTYLIQDNQAFRISDVTGGWGMHLLNEKRVLQTTYTGLVLLKKENREWQLERRLDNGRILVMHSDLHNNVLTGHHPFYGICVLRLSSNFDAVLSQNTFLQHDSTDFTKDVQLLSSQLGTIVKQNEKFFLANLEGIQPLKVDQKRSLDEDSIFQQDLRFFTIQKKLSSEVNVSKLNFYYDDPNLEHYLFGFEEGYLKVPKDWDIQNSNNLNVAIDFITINNKYKHLDNLNEALNPNQNDISIQFKKLKYYNKLNATYFYQLTNWDSNWYPLPKEGRIDFFNLNDGDYHLKLRQENRQSIHELLQFTIQPRWYESWIGVLLYLAMAVSLLIYLDKRNKQKLKQQSEKLKKEKEKELESARIKAENEKLEREVIYKSKMLANSTMTLVQKNKMLTELKDFIKRESRNSQYPNFPKQKILKLINRNIDRDQDWEIFERNFAAVHEDFLDTLKSKYPDITAGELKLAAYIKMNLSSKEIAPLLNISVRSVENKRYRLRKKMGVEHENNLKSHLMNL